jgi:ATP-dependent DNA helicase RecQ
VPPERQAPIQAALEVVNSAWLNDIRDRLGADYTYDEIRLVRGAWRRARAADTASP